MGVQLSFKAALLLAERIATASGCCCKTGPLYLFSILFSLLPAVGCELEATGCGCWSPVLLWVSCEEPVVPDAMATGSGGGSGDGRRGGSAGLESQAAAFFQQGSYEEAARLYSQCLANNAGRGKKETRLGLLFNRAATYTKLVGIQGCRDEICGLVQDCGNSIANALELPQSYAKPFRYFDDYVYIHTAWATLTDLNSCLEAQYGIIKLVIISMISAGYSLLSVAPFTNMV